MQSDNHISQDDRADRDPFIIIDKMTGRIIIRDNTGTLLTAGQALIVIADQIFKLFHLGRHIVPAIVTTPIVIVGNVVLDVTDLYNQLKDRMITNDILRISVTFEERRKIAKTFPLPVKKAMEEAAARQFLKDMAKYGVQNIVLDELLSA